MNRDGLNMFVLREDESGFGLSGCKKRKYASLIPWIQKHLYKEVALIGGGSSNHIASFLQLLNEKQIKAHLFLKKAYQTPLRGNRWLIDLLTTNEQITEIGTNDWDQAESWVQNQVGKEVYVVPEGGSCMPALPGSCTLFESVRMSETQFQLSYDHIFMDAGTGMMAGVMAYMLAQMKHPACLHVVLVAGNENSWYKQLIKIGDWWQSILGRPAPQPVNVHLYYPPSAKSFGAINAGVRSEIKRLAREEGILADPIYTAKLFMTVRHYIKSAEIQGNALVIHSGGGIGLLGHSPD